MEMDNEVGGRDDGLADGNKVVLDGKEYVLGEREDVLGKNDDVLGRKDAVGWEYDGFNGNAVFTDMHAAAAAPAAAAPAAGGGGGLKSLYLKTCWLEKKV